MLTQRSSGKTFFITLATCLLAILLSACGTGTTGGGQPTGRGIGGDSGGGLNPGDDDLDGAEVVEKVALRIEATDQMLASWHQELFYLLGPARAHALDGLTERNNISITNISLVELNQDFEEILGGDIPDYEVVRPETGNVYEIRFGQKIQERANFVIKVELSSSQTIYGPLYSTGETNAELIVNIGSHYVLKKLMDEVDSEEELALLSTCGDATSCTNQIQAKAKVIANASRMVQGYEIDIPGNLNVQGALSYLDSIPDIRTHVETLVQSITQQASPVAKGTPRSLQITDGAFFTRLNYNVEHNSVWLGVELNQLRPDRSGTETDVIMAAGNSQVVSKAEIGKPFPAYPRLNLNTTLLDVRRDTIVSEIPFRRSFALLDSEGNLNFNQNDRLNSFGFDLSDTYLSTRGFLLNDRLMQQTIDNSQSVGWSFNPMSSLLYRANDFEPDTSTENGDPEQEREYDASPTWLMAANYSTGGSFSNAASPPEFSRGEKLEGLNLFSWEIHGQETTESFSTSKINGKAYGVVAFGVRFDSDTRFVDIFAETYEWDAASNDFFESGETTYTIGRDRNYDVVPRVILLGAGPGDRDFYLVQTEESSQEFPNGSATNQGIVGINEGDDIRGHSSEDGRHLAFSATTLDRGRELIAATELRRLSASPIFSGETYVLQGNTIGMQQIDDGLGNIVEDINYAANVNGSTLVISDRESFDPFDIDCRATLTLNALRVDHDVTNNTVSQAAPWSADTPADEGPYSSSGCDIDGGKLTLNFDNVLGDPLILQGFVSQQGNASSTDTTPGRVINMVWVHENNLGLVFAHLEQNLSPNFDE